MAGPQTGDRIMDFSTAGYMGGGVPLPDEVQERFRASDGTKFHGFWEVMARQELAKDPTLLDRC